MTEEDVAALVDRNNERLASLLRQGVSLNVDAMRLSFTVEALVKYLGDVGLEDVHACIEEHAAGRWSEALDEIEREVVKAKLLIGVNGPATDVTRNLRGNGAS
jgi:uncharacterized protein (DUF2164 family)